MIFSLYPDRSYVKTPLLLIGLWLLGSLFARAQDPVFSQFYAAPLQVNPAFAGVTFSPRITLNYRSQWAAFDGGYSTYAAAFELGVESLNSGFGLMVTGDNALNGVYQNYRIHGMYTYQIRMGRQLYARVGVAGGWIGRQLDWNRLRFGDQLDEITGNVDQNGNETFSAEQPPESLNRNLFDLSAGLLINGRKWYLGGAVHHINNPNESFYSVSDRLFAGLPLRFTLHGGWQFDLPSSNMSSPEAFISPNVLFIRQADFSQLNAGAYVQYGKVYGGLWYRHSGRNGDALIGLVGFRYKIFRIGYSYDLTISGLSNQNTGGSHELSLTFDFSQTEAYKNRRRSRRFSDCYRMFE